jgi:hypothetical protein
MAGRKNYVLLDNNKNVVNQRFRYKSFQSAVRRAFLLAVEENKTCYIYDEDSGAFLCRVFRTEGGVIMRMLSPRNFYKAWSNHA